MERTLSERLRAARDGEPGAFDGVVRPHLRLLHSLALGVLGNPEDAEEAVQEALVRFFRKIPAVSAEVEVRAYLIRLVQNESRRLHRRRWLRWSREGAEGGPAEHEHPASQEREAHYSRIYQQVLSLVPRLTLREREVFVLRAFEDLAYEEIAESLGIRAVTARRLYSLARQRIISLLQEESGIVIRFPD